MPFPVGGAVRGVSAGLGLLVLTCAPARAIPSYAVSFDDPSGSYSAYYQAITTDVQAAGAAWASAFGERGEATLNIQIGFGGNSTAESSSVASHVIGRDLTSGITVYEQGAAARLLGDVAGGSGPDVRITIGTKYLTSELWFDPAPTARGGTVPAAKTDAYSIFLHEFGHIYAFNGWRNAQTGALPGAYESSFDRWVVRQGGDLFFEGPQAELVYGGPVLLTRGDYGHIGNAAGLPGSDLVSDLMNGVSFARGTRYTISALDLAIAADVGLPVAGSMVASSASWDHTVVGLGTGIAAPAVEVPEPSSLALFACVVLVLVPLARLLHRRPPGAWPARAASAAAR